MNFMDRIRNNKLALVVIVILVVLLAAQCGTGTNAAVEEGNTDRIVKQEADLATRQAELDQKEKELDELAKELADTEVEITTEDSVDEDALTIEDQLYIERMFGTNTGIVAQFSAIRELFSQFDSMDYDEFALQANEVLNELQEYLDEAKTIQPTDRFAEVDEVYNYALDEYEKFVSLTLLGIENIDSDMLDAATEHLLAGNEFLDETTLLLEDTFLQ